MFCSGTQNGIENSEMEDWVLHCFTIVELLLGKGHQWAIEAERSLPPHEQLPVTVFFLTFILAKEYSMLSLENKIL